ncbi:COG1569 Predicted nucleic acid-binding protein, contains PIN domain [Spirosomataceae bacterium]|jgi:putative PIN family toxin of toxin-antitoxin system
MKKIVFDTNVLVSALLFKTSKSRLAYEKALLNHQIISSLECYKELVEVLSRPKFSKYFSEIDKSIFLINYFHSTQFVKVNIVVEVCRDPKDNKFLALAFEHSSDFIVSADNDLPILNPYKNIPILTANGFLE